MSYEKLAIAFDIKTLTYISKNLAKEHQVVDHSDADETSVS